ncbi:MAG: glutathione S-transferase family protein, partial [Gammaproteobacteria bacterium]|nr:glutathione S-transferase family protein [Gammaproteobacteria bacterium]
MITLYGMALSNYFNKVKLALHHTEIDFNEVIVFPNQEADFLERSPMGKVPFI